MRFLIDKERIQNTHQLIEIMQTISKREAKIVHAFIEKFKNGLILSPNEIIGGTWTTRKRNAAHTLRYANISAKGIARVIFNAISSASARARSP